MLQETRRRDIRSLEQMGPEIGLSHHLDYVSVLFLPWFISSNQSFLVPFGRHVEICFSIVTLSHRRHDSRKILLYRQEIQAVPKG